MCASDSSTVTKQIKNSPKKIYNKKSCVMCHMSPVTNPLSPALLCLTSVPVAGHYSLIDFVDSHILEFFICPCYHITAKITNR